MNKLEHVNLIVESIEDSMSFIGAVFPHYVRRGGGTFVHADWTQEWVHFGVDDEYFSLFEAFPGSPVHEPDKRHPSPQIGHIGLEVDDLPAITGRLAQLGYEPFLNVNDHPHRDSAYFTDANGIVWELVEYSSDLPQEKNSYAE